MQILMIMVDSLVTSFDNKKLIKTITKTKH